MHESSLIEWKISDVPVEYPVATHWMAQRVHDVQSGNAPQCIWILEHPPLYTAGTSAKESDLFNPRGFPVFKTGRGGQYTYHGPGQKIVYVIIDLNQWDKDIRKYVSFLEQWITLFLSSYKLNGNTNPDRVGVWIDNNKIAAIGVRVQKWVTSHGFSINVNPDLTHFSGIVPCGINDQKYGVTSLDKLGINHYKIVQNLQNTFNINQHYS